jgi:hypothetical protein
MTGSGASESNGSRESLKAAAFGTIETPDPDAPLRDWENAATDPW